MTVAAQPPADAAADPGPAVAALDTIVSLAKRRGFVFPSSEIYGGINAVWDYGPLGRRAQEQRQARLVAGDGPGARRHRRPGRGHPDAARRSGSRPATSRRSAIRWSSARPNSLRFRLDELPGTEGLTATDMRDPTIVERLGLQVPGRRRRAVPATPLQPDVQDVHGPGRGRGGGRLPAARDGAGRVRQLQERAANRRARRCHSASPRSARAFRNEITPGNFVFRMREFEQMEMQYFVRPETAATSSRSGCRGAGRGTCATA